MYGNSTNSLKVAFLSCHAVVRFAFYFFLGFKFTPLPDHFSVCRCSYSTSTTMFTTRSVAYDPNVPFRTHPPPPPRRRAWPAFFRNHRRDEAVCGRNLTPGYDREKSARRAEHASPAVRPNLPPRRGRRRVSSARDIARRRAGQVAQTLEGEISRTSIPGREANE